MLPFYENFNENLEIHEQQSRHVRPHLHKSMECIYVTKGTLELGIGQELYHMEKHAFAIVFPELIHHYQVFDSDACHAVYLLAAPSLSGGFLRTLQNLAPDTPHREVLWLAYTQMILARTLPYFEMIEKSSVGSDDIIYRTVAYMAAHFREDLSLTQMAEDLGYSPYALSRVFSSTFHCNFNTYLNNMPYLLIALRYNSLVYCVPLSLLS